MSKTKPRKTIVPGDDAGAEPVAETTGAEEAGESNVDEAIDAAQAGKARKIKKPHVVPPPAVLPRPDPERPTKAAVNAKKEMPYDGAMALRESGQLTRAVLTEKGWVTASDREPPAATKR